MGPAFGMTGILRRSETLQTCEHARDDSIAARRVELECAGHDRSEPPGHDATDHHARPVQPGLDGLIAKPETEAGLRRAQPLDVAQRVDLVAA